MTDVVQAPAAPATEEDVTTTLYRAAIGPVGTGYYLPIFTRFEAADHAGISWNHAAGFLTLNWLIFRQLWLAAFGYATIVLTLTLLVYGIGRLVLDFSDTLMMVLGLGFGLAAFVLPGLFGNALLHSECRKRMAKALTAHANVADACTQLTQKASTRRRMLWQAGVNAAVALVAIVVYLQFSVASAPPVAAEAGHVVTGQAVDMAANGPAAPPASAMAVASAAAASSVSSPVSAPASAQTLTGVSTSTSSPALPLASSPASAALAAASGPASATAGTHASAPATAQPLALPPMPVSSATAHASTALPSAPAITPSATTKAASPSSAPAAASAASTAKATASAAVANSSTPQPAASTAARPAASAVNNTVVRVSESPKRTAEAPAKHAVAAQEHVKKDAPKPNKEEHASAPSHKPYFINVGLFANPDNAANAHAKLLEAHLPSVTKELKSTKVPLLIRVRVGPFATADEANAAAAKIKALQLDAVVIQL